MIFQILKDNETKETFTTFDDCWNCTHSRTFSPVVDILFITDFKIKGKNYKERKESARSLAIELQRTFIDYDIYTSYSEVMQLSNIFERIGKKYGLLKEYNENGII